MTLYEQTTTSTELPHPVTPTRDRQGLRPLAQTERITAADASQEDIDSRFFAIVTDLVGTPSKVVDERGAIASGLHYNYFRRYDPETARCPTPDPLGLTPAPNPSTHVHDPHMWAAPLGLSPCPGTRHEPGGRKTDGRDTMSSFTATRWETSEWTE